jgi:DNA-binding transcriptional LysR family regulator
MTMAAQHANWFLRARLKTRQLMLLVALDEERNIHRTAEELGMSQPAASKLLKDLEEMLEVPLFDRLPRGMRPTWYGEIMIRHARMVLASLNQAHEEISALKSGQTGQVHIGVIMTPGTSLIPQAIARIKEAHPYLHVNVHMDTSDMLQPMLRQGKLDILVARLIEAQDNSGLLYEPLADEPVCIVAGPHHPLRHARNTRLADLTERPWILPPINSLLRHRVDMSFREVNLEPPKNVVETMAPLVITNLLEQSDLLAVLPVDIARHYAKHGMLAVLPIELPCTMDYFGIITRRDQILAPGAALMLEALRETAATLYPKSPVLSRRR